MKLGRGGSEAVLMTEGSILRCLVLFSLPLILGNLLQQTYNAADALIVGNFVGAQALAAVGSSASLIYLLIAFSQGAAVGAGVLAAQYMGARNERRLRLAVHTALAVACILGLLLTVGGVLFSRSLLIWMNTPAEVLDTAALYLELYSGGMLFSVVYNMLAGLLNAVGNSVRPLIFLSAGALIHVALDFFFIAGLGLGVAGAALSTDISQAIACLLALRYVVRVRASYAVRLGEVRLHRETALGIVRIGLPTGVQNMVISLSNILVQAGVNGFGAVAMAGFGAYMNVDGFNILPLIGLSMAITTFVGQNYGARRLDRVRRGMRAALALTVGYTLFTGLTLLTFSGFVMQLFTDEPDVIAYGCEAMLYFCPFYWVLGILHSLAGAVRGTGRTIPPMVILLFAMCAFRVFWLTFILPSFDDISGIFVLYPVSWALGACLMALYTWRAHWLTEPLGAASSAKA